MLWSCPPSGLYKEECAKCYVCVVCARGVFRERGKLRMWRVVLLLMTRARAYVCERQTDRQTAREVIPA